MSTHYLDRIREQFTRTADVYTQMSQTTDARGLEALVRLSGAGSSDRTLAGSRERLRACLRERLAAGEHEP